jgi:hypothetical protein
MMKEIEPAGEDIFSMNVSFGVVWVEQDGEHLHGGIHFNSVPRQDVEPRSENIRWKEALSSLLNKGELSPRVRFSSSSLPIGSC